MKLFRRSHLIVAAAVAVACERAKAPPKTDSAVRLPGTVVDSTSAVAAPPAWDPSAGPVLLIAADAPVRAFVFVPDTAARATTLANIPRPASVTLFGRNGSVQTAELPGVSDTSACLVATLSAAPPPRPWSVGFVGGVVAPIAMDSAGSLSRADSTALTTGLIRLASALPNDAAGRFTGLPFIVRSIWRFGLPQGSQFIAGTLSRSINQEATPLQERTLIVAERAQSDSSLATVYSERSYGDEETIETRDIVAAVQLGTGHNIGIVIARDFGDATAYAFVERGDDGRWRIRWASPRRHC